VNCLNYFSVTYFRFLMV